MQSTQPRPQARQLLTYTNDSSVLAASSASQEMLPYYCRVCGSMALVISTPLDALYRRRSDQALIVECDRHVHKKMGSMQKAVKVQVVRRGEKGIEKHYNWNCKECQFLISQILRVLWFLIGYQCHDSTPIGTEKIVTSYNTDDMYVGPGARGKDDNALAEDKEKRKHFYIRAMQPGGQPTLVANAQESELMSRLKELKKQ